MQYTRLEKFTRNKASSLLGQFLSYKENEVSWILPQGPYAQHFIFFVTYEYTQLRTVLHYTGLKRPSSDKHSSLLGEFLSYKETGELWIQLQGPKAQHFIFLVAYEWAQ